MKKPIVLAIMDGVGIGQDGEYNAVRNANTPTLDMLMAKYPSVELKASGLDVGLPKGQMGNSEVGHLNIGAGRVVFQSLSRIDNAFADKSINENKILVDAINYARGNDKAVHILGLASDGGVHSRMDHMIMTANLAKSAGVKNVFSHAITDGRDVHPKSALASINKLDNVATISGRYFAMDRDKNFDRLNSYLEVLFNNNGKTFNSIEKFVEEEYAENRTDEFFTPARAESFDGVKEGDVIIFANFRPDRAIQLTATLTNDNYVNKFAHPKVKFITFTDYSDDCNAEILFDKSVIKNTIGEVVSKAGLKQLRVAETEKYAHVTFFMDGGQDVEFVGADRILVQSPAVATYDLQPEMSLPEVTEKLVAALKTEKYEMVILNFANCDMVGHSGDYDAVVKSVEAVDNGIGQIYEEVNRQGGVMLVTADHGNAELMRDETGPVTKHTTNKVPMIITSNDIELANLDAPSISNIAPTILKLLDVEIPKEMTSAPLIK